MCPSANDFLATSPPMDNHAVRRLNMVESQLRTNKVTDPRILRAMAEMPREQFMPDGLRGIAYVDEDVAISNGRFLMEPMVLARLIQAAQIKPSDLVLELGAGRGYATAILAKLASTVVSVESDAQLAAVATEALRALGVDNAIIVPGALPEGHAAQAPYDVILFGGAIAEVPKAILAQLAEGGRMVGVLAPEDAPGRACVWTRRDGAVFSRLLFDANTPLLPGFGAVQGFVFQ
jgi:protein-L-isoaspartate(D-aspartate) O-methyltransferase